MHKYINSLFFSHFISAIAAGFLISASAIIAHNVSGALGAFLFSIGLFTICEYSLNLYTGKAGYIRQFGIKNLLLVWLGNFLGSLPLGIFARLFLNIPNFTTKLARPWDLAFVYAILCGLLMFIAVDAYQRGQGFAKYLGILLCVPAFILATFEHSIADMFYFFAAGVSLEGVLFLLLMSLGNFLGAQILTIFKKA